MEGRSSTPIRYKQPPGPGDLEQIECSDPPDATMKGKVKMMADAT
jgi:hypothetical protein